MLTIILMVNQVITHLKRCNLTICGDSLDQNVHQKSRTTTSTDSTSMIQFYRNRVQHKIFTKHHSKLELTKEMIAAKESLT